MPLHRLPEHRGRGEERGRRDGEELTMAVDYTTQTSGGIGDAVLRKEDRKFVTGEGRYTDDLKLPGMLHAFFVRSPFAHAKIKSIDTAAALAPNATAPKLR